MFLTAPNVWLQSWASPGLTRALEVISWFGYTRTAIAFAVLIAFAYHLRLGMALLLLLGLTSAATDVAKTSAALPRPFAVDSGVRILGWPAPAPIRWGNPASTWWELPGSTPPPSAVAGERANAADSETGFGFPSGHVSTTVTFVAGLTALLRRRWIYAAGLTWLALMALSRLYLGRHFIGDVLGGLVLGGLVVGIGLIALRLASFVQSSDTRVMGRAAQINALVGAALLAAALLAGQPNVGDAGQLAGIAGAVSLLTWLGMVHLPPQPFARAALVIAAGASYGLVWAALTIGVPGPRTAASAGIRLAASALPAFAMLAVPAAIASRMRTAPLTIEDA